MQYPRVVALVCFLVSLSATAGMKLCTSTSNRPECRDTAAKTTAPATTTQESAASDEFWIFRVI
jgi:hypothetical protein